MGLRRTEIWPNDEWNGMNQLMQRLHYNMARSRVKQMEDAIRQLPDHVEGDSDDFPLTHTFVDGIYVREILLPKGSICVGKLHKTRHPNFLLEGKVRVTCDHSTEVIEIEAPTYFVSEPGMKKVVYALEDSIWITIHATDKTTPEEAEEDVIAKDYDSLPKDIKERLWLS